MKRESRIGGINLQLNIPVRGGSCTSSPAKNRPAFDPHYRDFRDLFKFGEAKSRTTKRETEKISHHFAHVLASYAGC
jgi:hypothetical protein